MLRNISPVSIKAKLYQEFGLRATSIARIKVGVMNQNFRIKTDAGVFMFRVYGAKTEPETRLERYMLLRLSAKGFPCPSPRLTQTGRDAIDLNGRPAILYPLLAGASRKQATPAIMRELGALQGTIHTAFRHEPITHEKNGWDPEDIKRLIKDWRSRIEKSKFPHAKNYLNFIERELADCSFPVSLPRGLTHQDIKPENVLIKNGRVSGVLDFDNCYRGAFLHDLTTTIMWWCFPRGTFSPALTQAFLQGYETKRRLTKSERDGLLKDGLRFRLLREMFIGPMTTLSNVPLAVKRAAYFQELYRETFGKE